MQYLPTNVNSAPSPYQWRSYAPFQATNHARFIKPYIKQCLSLEHDQESIYPGIKIAL